MIEPSECCWCDGERQSRYHLVARCRAWAPQGRMWREIGRACGRKQLTAPAVKNIFGDERTTEAVLTFLRDTEVGCMVAIAPLGEEGEVAEGEEDVVFAFVCGRVSIVFPLIPSFV